MAKKAASLKIKLVSSAGTGHYYVTKKNSRTQTDKLVMNNTTPSPKSMLSIARVRLSKRLA